MYNRSCLIEICHSFLNISWLRELKFILNDQHYVEDCYMICKVFCIQIFCCLLHWSLNLCNMVAYVWYYIWILDCCLLYLSSIKNELYVVIVDSLNKYYK